MKTLLASIVLVIALFVYSFFIPKRKLITHGSAELKSDSKKLSYWNKGFKIGNKSLTINDSTRHVCLVAPSGSGKSQTLILPNVFHLAAKDCSLICLDIKAELTNITSAYLVRLGLSVHVINLIEPEKSEFWNVLEDVENNNFQSLVTDMYDIANSGKETESIWRYGTIEVITIFCQVLNNYQKRRYLNLANLLRLLRLAQSHPKRISAWMLNACEDEHLIEAIERLFTVDEKIFHGQMSGATATIIPFVSDDLKLISSKTTLPSIKTFRERQSCLFITLPIGRESQFMPYVTLLTKRLFDQIINSKTKKTDRYIAFLLDEFGQMTISGYPSIISTIRSKRTMLFHSLQNFEQISYRYNKDVAQIIANNCTTWILLSGSKSEATLSFVSESLIGKTTHIKKDGQTVSRLLLNKDEIRRLPNNSALFITGNEQPALLKLKPLYKSWYLKWRYGLKSVGGELVSLYEPVRHFNQTHIEYIDFNEINENETYHNEDESFLSFKERLEKLLPKDKEKE